MSSILAQPEKPVTEEKEHKSRFISAVKTGLGAAVTFVCARRGIQLLSKTIKRPDYEICPSEEDHHRRTKKSEYGTSLNQILFQAFPGVACMVLASIALEFTIKSARTLYLGKEPKNLESGDTR